MRTSYVSPTRANTTSKSAQRCSAAGGTAIGLSGKDGELVVARKRAGTVDLGAHPDVPWVAGRQGSFCHAVVLHTCRAAGFEPRITHFTNDFATAYGFHIPSRTSLIPKATTLSKGQAAEAAKIATDNGHAQSPILWTPKCASAFGDMMTRVVKDGAKVADEVAKLKPVVDAEIKRVAG